MLALCGPHSQATFKRESGNLRPQVEWGDEGKYIKAFVVKYRGVNTTEWKENYRPKYLEMTIHCYRFNDYYLFQQLLPKNGKDVLWNITSSLAYELKIQCVPTKECAQCLTSDVFMVPRELTEAPSVQWEIQETQNPSMSAGKRRLILMWKYASTEAVESYCVTVRKASENSSSAFRTKDSSLTLLLSYSAYNISIRALNSAGSSPASSPYTRYHFFLHTRPDQDTCDMKNVNNSETTYSIAHSYLTEGRITVDPGICHYKLTDLKSSSSYTQQEKGSEAKQSSSSQIQKCLLTPLIKQKFEESEDRDTSILCIVEYKNTVTPPGSPSTAMKTTIILNNDEKPTMIQKESKPHENIDDCASKQRFPLQFRRTDSILSTSDDHTVKNHASAMFFMSDYTTMEIFQQSKHTTMDGSVQHVDIEDLRGVGMGRSPPPLIRLATGVAGAKSESAFASSGIFPEEQERRH
ncbi:hypothetical protein DNTS_025273 [Danionella cerebrum]|uniref:Fibronectin type-III domain-containing protein n=1 Tax=Danionella cerebrum TaxID=2873325 RepID=A0A553PIJ6_9TELE|nr:hypothetical protein DNTS_025273 [Danionella translucida]